MFDNLADKHTIPDIALELLGNRALLGIIIRALLGRKHDVDGRRLASEDLGGKAFLSKIDHCAVNLIQQDSGDDTVDLQGKLGRLDDVQAADQGINNDGKTSAVVDGNGIGLVGNLDDTLVAA